MIPFEQPTGKKKQYLSTPYVHRYPFASIHTVQEEGFIGIPTGPGEDRHPF